MRRNKERDAKRLKYKMKSAFKNEINGLNGGKEDDEGSECNPLDCLERME